MAVWRNGAPDGGWNVNEQPPGSGVPPTHFFALEALLGTSASVFKIRDPNSYAFITLSIESYGRLGNSEVFSKLNKSIFGYFDPINI